MSDDEDEPRRKPKGRRPQVSDDDDYDFTPRKPVKKTPMKAPAKKPAKAKAPVEEVEEEEPKAPKKRSVMSEIVGLGEGGEA